MINYDKHIWKGWCVKDFINELEIILQFVQSKLKTREDVKKWCMSDQPYYKEYIPEVVDHFCKKLNIK